MSDLLTNILQANKIGFLSIMFLTGLSGSIHCVGMCGAFASSCSSKGSHLLSYQAGRMISYGLLGFLGGLLGSLILSFIQDPIFQSLPSLFLGATFILLGIKIMRGRSFSLKSSKFLNTIIGKIYKVLFGARNITLRSFLLGVSSSLLPCGLLYGVIIALSTFQSPSMGLIGMLVFCLGTMPALIVAPKILAKVISPLKERWPLIFGMSTTFVGISIITIRLVSTYEKVLCH